MSKGGIVQMKQRLLRTLAMVLVMMLCAVMMPADTIAYAQSAQKVSAKAAATTVTIKSATKSAGYYTVKMRQVKVGNTNIKVTLPKMRKNVAKVKVTLSMTYKKNTTTKKTFTVKRAKMSKKSFVIKAPAFGKYKATVRFYNKKGKVLKKIVLYKVGVVADEYNIMLMSGSFGPTFFSMSLLGAEDPNSPGVGVKTKTDAGKPIPTIVSLKRSSTYNWKALPSGTRRNPLDSNYTKDGKSISKTRAMAQYVKELRSLDKNSKFHFYFPDNCVNNLGILAYSNNIPSSRFDCTFITDGTASYTYFNRMYDLEGVDPNVRYKEMVTEWDKYKKLCKKGKESSYKNLKYAEVRTNSGMAHYTYVAVKESPNVTWWVSRFNGTFASKDADFLAEAKTYVNEMGMNNMLNSLSEKGKANAFKKWFNFSDNMFEDAVKNNKDVMILMGTRVNQESYFEEFATFVKQYYGDSFEYYYKGHPGTPTGLYPEKVDQLKRTGLHDVESSIPAELILFFNPDVYVSGMSNSTLNFSYKEGRTKAFFGARKEAALMPVEDKGVYNSELFELFFTKITDAYEPEILALCGEDISGSFLIEFNDTTAHDIGIFDYAAKTIKYYKLGEEGYQEVAEDGTPIE